MIEQHSRFDLTKDLYAMLFYAHEFFIWRFLLKNSNNFCAFCYIVYVCIPGHIG